MVVPERISNRIGSIEFPVDQAVLVPSLREATRAVVAQHFDDLGLSVSAINRPLTEPWRLSDGSPNTSPWWWLMSPVFLRGWLTLSGFEVVDECWTWEGRSYSFLTRRV